MSDSELNIENSVPSFLLDTITTTQPGFYEPTTSVFDNETSNYLDYLSSDYRCAIVEPKSLTLRYNAYNCICVVCQIDPLSFEMDLFGEHRQAFFGFQKIAAMIYNNVNENVHQFLGVMEQAPSKGFHMHLLLIFAQSIDHKTVKNVQQAVPIDIKINDEDQQEYKVLSSVQKIRSFGSYINYLHKDVRGLIGHRGFIDMFLTFDRTLIFPSTSVPKFTKYNNIDKEKINSTNPLVIFFYKLLEQGYTSFSEVLTHPQMQNFVHQTNVDKIWNNCYQQYRANWNHLDSILYMFKGMNTIKQTSELFCICPMIEWLKFQDIDEFEFRKSVFNWLLCTEKKNALMFIGKPDSGKSHIARLFWSLFPSHTRIIQDGIFTFANLVGADCGLWDEPFIAPDLADTTKLILEGEASVNVAIKNQSARPLGHRVPIIITTNHALDRYTSADKQAFDARLYKFKTFHQFQCYGLCPYQEHYCPGLDSTNYTFETIEGPSSRKNKRQRTINSTAVQEEESVEDFIDSLGCKQSLCRHALKKDHVLAYVLLTFKSFKQELIDLQKLKILDNPTSKDIQKYTDIYNYCTKLETSLCETNNDDIIIQ